MRLNDDFFELETLDLAKKLIGKVFTYESPQGKISGIICETEAYTEEDESCHAYKGNRTPKNEVMFYKSGHFYIYFTYGMYFCSNIVSGKKDKGEAVLIRGIIPIEGQDIIKQNRINARIKNLDKKLDKEKIEKIKESILKLKEKKLCDGPAKFCIGFGFDKSHNGYDLLKKNSKIYIEDLGYVPKKINQTTRIGISKAKELEWRFIGEF